jgi:signal transduction histidine kinase
MRSKAQISKHHDILLVEDDDNYARLIGLYLEEATNIHCSTTHCRSLSEACGLLDSGREFAAVLLDLSLPDSDGFATLTNMIQRFPKLNVIIMTSQSDKSLGLEAVKSGAQDFLVKGDFDKEQLAKVLHYSIERSQILIRLEETQQIAHIGHWECSPAEHFFYASEEAYRIFGLQLNRSFTCEEIMKEDNPFAPLMAIQGKAQKESKAQVDQWIKRVGGEKRFVTIFCTAAYVAEKGYIYNGIIQDITERKRAEEAHKARNLAEQEAKVREQLIANVSHEMRTPMNAILGMSNLLLKTTLDAEQQKYVNAISQSSEVLLNIINDILTTSALQNDQLRFVLQPVHLKALIQNLMNLMAPKAAEKGLSLHYHIDETLPEPLMADSSRLNQILYNLVGNAIKFTEQGEVVLEVRLKEQLEQEATLQFVVKDTGIGVPPEIKESLFLPFTRGEHADSIYEGTGLGLSITRSLIERQGGRIWFESEVGKGASFFFELTLEKVAPSEPSNPKKAIRELPRESRFCLLLVEDHPLNRFVAQKMLKKQWENAELISVENGDEAIACLSHTDVDLILMDLQMPVRDGFSTISFLKTQMPEAIAHTPIIAMTAHANITLNEQFVSSGFDDFILKPFTPEQLLEKVQYYLLLKKGRQ